MNMLRELKIWSGKLTPAWTDSCAVTAVQSTGLPDQSIAYDVITKCPTTMEETMNLVTWHLTCKSGMRGRAQVRAIEQEEMDQTIEDIDCRRVGNRYVTEERLNQFGRDIKESMTRDICWRNN